MRSLLPAILLVLLPAQIAAQSVGTLTGRVSAENAAPLPQARVRVIGSDAPATVLSGNDGRFRLPDLAAGDRILEIRLLGYLAVTRAVTIAAGQTVDVQIILAAAPILLKAQEVRGEPMRLPAMEAFEKRRAHGGGHYFNRAEIARMQPRSFTDVLRRVPGVQIQPIPGPFGPSESVRMSRTIGVSGSRICPVLYYINGMPLPVTGEISIDQYVIPEDVIAVEVYSGSSQIPSEFQANLLNARCGVIVIWTRMGNEDDLPSRPPPPPAPPPEV